MSLFVLLCLVPMAVFAGPGELIGTSQSGKPFIIRPELKKMTQPQWRAVNLWWLPGEGYRRCTLASRLDGPDSWAMACENDATSAFSGAVYAPSGKGKMTCVRRCSDAIPRAFEYREMANP